jgi:hypothetical protein
MFSILRRCENREVQQIVADIAETLRLCQKVGLTFVQPEQ